MKGDKHMDSLFIKNFVDSKFQSGKEIDHEAIANEFLRVLKKDFDDQRFENLLIVSGFIPDLYSNDSSEETLYSKLIEALVCEWANRIGASGQLLKQKASYEDVQITVAEKIIVCDSKSFRLGRSQQAPNAKDFLKLEDIRKWMNRYPNAIGGLVTYPCKHEWRSSSDIYQYCSTKDAPTLMLPYKYLAFLLHYKDKFSAYNLLTLWDYDKLFPNKLSKTMSGGNKAAYWHQINMAIAKLVSVPLSELREYMSDADKKIEICVKDHLTLIEELKAYTIKNIELEIQKTNDINKLKKLIITHQTLAETRNLDVLIERINKFRL